MGIGLTEEHQALAVSVRGQAERSADHAALAGQGLLGLHLGEERGGQGYGLLELCVALEALAARPVPGPYLPTVPASAALARSGGTWGDLIAALADGSMAATVALPTALPLAADPAAAGAPAGGDGPPISAAALALGSAGAGLFLLPVGGGAWAV